MKAQYALDHIRCATIDCDWYVVSVGIDEVHVMHVCMLC